MSRSGGVYTAPAGTTVTTNTPIESAPYNALVADLVQDANTDRPIIAGGTGASTAVGAMDNLLAQSSNISAGSTVNLATATGNYVLVDGTGETITSFGTVSAGSVRFLRFNGANTLTHNDTSLILPGAADITTADGDKMTLISEGSGNWRCWDYDRAAFPEADQWRLTTALITNAVLTNVERVDDASFGKIGAGMSESSGVFTFPRTGVWIIMLSALIKSYPDDFAEVQIQATQNNGSAWDEIATAGYEADVNNTGGRGGTVSTFAMFNVADLANDKVRIASVGFASNTQVNGNTNTNDTCFTFIRLGG